MLFLVNEGTGVNALLCTNLNQLTLHIHSFSSNVLSRYRIMAFDHDLLSFVDVRYNEWPAIVITNPKRARFMVPKHEPVHKMVHSTPYQVSLLNAISPTGKEICCN